MSAQDISLQRSSAPATSPFAAGTGPQDSTAVLSFSHASMQVIIFDRGKESAAVLAPLFLSMPSVRLACEVEKQSTSSYHLRIPLVMASASQRQLVYARAAAVWAAGELDHALGCGEAGKRPISRTDSKPRAHKEDSWRLHAELASVSVSLRAEEAGAGIVELSVSTVEAAASPEGFAFSLAQVAARCQAHKDAELDSPGGSDGESQDMSYPRAATAPQLSGLLGQAKDGLAPAASLVPPAIESPDDLPHGLPHFSLGRSDSLPLSTGPLPLFQLDAFTLILL